MTPYSGSIQNSGRSHCQLIHPTLLTSIYMTTRSLFVTEGEEELDVVVHL